MILFCFFSSLAPWSITPVPQKKKQKYHLYFPKKWWRQRGNLRTQRTLMVSEMAENNNCSLSFRENTCVLRFSGGMFSSFSFFLRHLWRNLTPPDILIHKWSWLVVGAGPDRAWLTSWLPANFGIHKLFPRAFLFPKKVILRMLYPLLQVHKLSRNTKEKIDGKTNV